jgi:hypothetical protein
VLITSGTVLAAAPAIVPRLLDVSPEVAAAIPGAALPLGIITVTTGVLLWLFRSGQEAALAALTWPVAMIPLVSQRLMTEVGRERSAAALAQAIVPFLGPKDNVVAVETFPLSLPFYLGRTVLLATESGRELTSTYLADRWPLWSNMPGSPARPADWWREAVEDCRARVFVTRASDRETRTVLEARLPLLIQTRRHAAYGPCGALPLAEVPRRSLNARAVGSP